uniref:cactin-like n=1 Tax=Styela clava TaxID=7725 RepID=UPI00193A51E7|nr:cactin-like [Styela clava]
MGKSKYNTEKKHRRERSSSREQRRDKERSYKKKKSKSRKRSRSLSHSSSISRSPSGSDRSRDGDKKEKEFSLEKEKRRIKEEKKMQKEIRKALETPEEKRERRIAKKEEKERKRREKMGWDKEYMGYTNTDNPFGDSKLLDTFVWHKKLDQQGLKNLSVIEKKKIMHQKQDVNKVELAKVKQQRLERERERHQRDEEMEIIQREKEADHFKVWEEQEDKFHLEQAKLRSRIRIKDGRAKPIDLLAKYASSAENMDDLSGIEMQEPYTYLNGLTIFDLEDLLADIKIYMELEQSKNIDFWRDMTVITEEELQKLKRIAVKEQEQSTSGIQARESRREGVNRAVADDVANIFHSKSHSQLVALHKSMTERIKAGGSSLDVGYWESLLSQLKAYMAKARLRDSHQELLKSKLYKLKLDQLGADAVENTLFPIKPETDPEAGKAEEEDDSEKEEEKQEETMTEEDWENRFMEEYEAGGFSPKLLRSGDIPPDTIIIDAAEAALTLEGRRKLLKKTGDASTGTEDAFVRHVKEGMDNAADEDEAGATFAVEAQISQQVYLWADKYRPRKPRFFNRVHTGFEWNKYNQTHYDFDNPPPKIVQGYKFNIFYPDLINKSEAPTYTITPTGDKDFAILRFSSGPPYEDIAFKIVNREWEYSHKHGFRCQFINSIFQLWFHFKRYRYRR